MLASIIARVGDDTETQTARRPWIIVTPIMTVVADLFVLFGPIETTSTSDGLSTSGLVGNFSVLATVLIVLLTVAGIATGLCYWQRQLGLVGVSSVILCLGVVVSLPSIGLFFLPAAAASVGTWISLYRNG